MIKEELEDKAFWADIPIDDEPVIYLSDVVKIIEDFESRTCANCKYGESEDLGIYCPFVNYCGSDYMQKDFGCRKWQSKTVSTDTKSHSQD